MPKSAGGCLTIRLPFWKSEGSDGRGLLRLREPPELLLSLPRSYSGSASASRESYAAWPFERPPATSVGDIEARDDKLARDP